MALPWECPRLERDGSSLAQPGTEAGRKRPRRRCKTRERLEFPRSLKEREKKLKMTVNKNGRTFLYLVAHMLRECSSSYIHIRECMWEILPIDMENR